MLTRLSLLIAVCGAVTSGCASLSGYPSRPDDSAIMSNAADLYGPDAVRQYTNETDQKKRALQRNRFVTSRIFVLNTNYEKFLKDLIVQRNSMSLGTDWVVLGLAGAGAVVGAATTKAALAAASAGILGAKTAVDKDVFYEKTMPALIAQMNAQRKEVLARIYSGLQKDDDNYPLFQALSDLEDYYSAGTIVAAIEGVTASANEASQNATRKIDAVLSGKFSFDDASDAIRKFWKPNEKINQNNQNQIIDWMDAHKISTGDISSFIYMPQFAAQRAQAAKELKLK